MINDRTVSDLSEDGSDLYPHLKITAEPFPRVLATRRFEDDGAEYYGAFLTKTAVRIMLGFLNKTFRLRTCDIEIDGTFPVPCTQFYLNRCLGPCVKNLCDRESYLQMVSLARLFLADQRRLLTAEINLRIRRHSEDLEFEAAASWRDMLLSIEDYWNNTRLNVWLDDTVDTYVADETIAGSFIYLATQRGRNILGRKVFQMPKGGGIEPHEAVERIIASFYRFHLPKEIRVSMDFEGRQSIAAELSGKFGREVTIVLTRPDKQLITSIRALRQAHAENDLEFAKAKATPRQISGELRRLFHLGKLPTRVEAFDVAHISGKSFVAASAVWANGRFRSEEYRFHISEKTRELEAMSDAVMLRLADPMKPPPDLILIDGGKIQLNAVRNAHLQTDLLPFSVVGAVKPRGKHSSVAYFISENGIKTEYDPDNPAQKMLRLLRDDAHDLANRVHRDLRDLGHHYELAALLPGLSEIDRRRLVTKFGSVKRLLSATEAELAAMVGPEYGATIFKDFQNKSSSPAVPFIVPIRFVEQNGEADDLRPIRSS